MPANKEDEQVIPAGVGERTDSVVPTVWRPKVPGLHIHPE